MQKLAEISIRRPVFATVIILALVVIGAFAYYGLGVDRFPKVEFPFVTVTTILPGAAPEEVETEITDKLEASINTVSGIEEMFSSSSEGVSVIQVSFVLDKNGDVAAQEVRDKVNAVLSELPEDAEPPLIQKLQSDAAPVIAVALSGPATIRDISEYAEKVMKRRLETINGVGNVLLVGARPRQININLDTAKLDGLGLTAADVVNALRSQNVQIPGGKVETGARDLTLRTYGRVRQPLEFGDIQVAQRDGQSIRVRDVARVEDSIAEPESVGSINGNPGVVLLVQKQSGANPVAVVEAVKERSGDLRSELPKGWKMELVRDQSEFVIAALDSVKEHLILGSIFAAGIVWLFLRKFRPTLIAAVAIPSSLIATFAAMAFMGFTLNVITLLALTLAVGIVIDDAVVVLENVFRHMEEKKLTPMQAAVSGTKEVALAVMATSASLIVVFLPVAFMGGIVGRFMYSFGITMAFAIAVSLLVSFTLTPMMASRMLKKDDVGHGEISREKGVYAVVESTYLRMLDWSMKHRWVIVVAMVGTFLAMIPLFGLVDKNFLPVEDESQFTVEVRAPEGASLRATETIMESIDKQIRKLPEVDTTIVTIGDDFQKTQNLGSLHVALVPRDKRKVDQFQVMDKVRNDILGQYQRLNLRTNVSEVNAFGGGRWANIMFWVGGPDLDQLDAYAKQLMEVVKNQPGTIDVDTNYVVGKPELGVEIDREKAADLGVRVQDLASTLNVAVGGFNATSYYEGGEEYEVRVRAEERWRNDPAAIAQMQVPSMKLGSVPLRDVVKLAEGTGPSVINRFNRRRQVLIYANMQPGYSAQTVMDALGKAAEDLKMPPAFSYGFTGQSQEQVKAAASFGMAFLLSIIFMYLILAAQFESWLHPITILLSLPMTVPFALVSLLLLNQSLNIFSALGILVLFGIVKKNSILQVDHTNGLRAQGMPRAEAIRTANRDRLRPILMTTLAFVAGMIPLVVSSGTGAGTNRAMGSVIIGGQTLALLLTLLGTPVAYSIFDDWAQSRIFSRSWDWVRSRVFRRTAGVPAPVMES